MLTNEKLLHFIWQQQLFNATELKTVQGDSLRIIHKGNLNTHQGPDFTDAKIQLNDLIFIGNIELHLRHSDWEKHRHQEDSNYDNVILHVVYEYDKAVAQIQNLPTLVLDNRIAHILLEKYTHWMEAPQTIPCANQLTNIPTLHVQSWLEKLFFERLEQRAEDIFARLKTLNGHWNQLFWENMAFRMAGQQNGPAFQECVQKLGFEKWAKLVDQNVAEAVWLGQLGLLDNKNSDDVYHEEAQKEFAYFRHKWQLTPNNSPIYFLRMRPPSFPTIRMAQLLLLFRQKTQAFSQLFSCKDIQDVKNVLHLTEEYSYWNSHYTIDGKAHKAKPLQISEQTKELLIINAIVPILFAYGKLHSDHALLERLESWMLALEPEENSTIRQWKQYGIHCQNALESQALLQAQKNYCQPKLCLDCSIGQFILRRINTK